MGSYRPEWTGTSRSVRNILRTPADEAGFAIPVISCTLNLAARFRRPREQSVPVSRYLTNVAADKHFSVARSARDCWMCLQLN